MKQKITLIYKNGSKETLHFKEVVIGEAGIHINYHQTDDEIPHSRWEYLNKLKEITIK